MTAAQALEFRMPYKLGPELEEVFRSYRLVVQKLEKDRVLSPDIFDTIAFMKKNKF